MGYPRHAMHMYAHPTGSPHQSAYQQQHMPPVLSAGATPYATSPHVGINGAFQRPVSFTGANAASPMASASHQQHSMSALAHGMQASQHPQMPYNRGALGAQSMNMAGGMFRSPVSGNSSVTFGNVGLSRAAIAEQSRYMYAPSPLGQMPMYGPPPIMEGSAGKAAAIVPPEMQMPHHPAPMAGYMPAAIPNGPMRSLPPAQQQSPHPHQQTAAGAARNGQEALMNFIPNHERCSGTISKNPLMRDLNKIKQFSAKDYSSRPTLLAEVDSRQLAKRNMPGLGGSTCHSFQPEVPPPPPMQSQPQQQYSSAGYHSSPPARPQDHHDHDTYYSHPHDPHYTSRRPDPARRKHASRQDSYEKARGYSFSSSNSRNKHRAESKSDRGRSSRKHRDQGRGRDTYGSEYEERPAREFRQRKPRQRSRGRSSRGRSHHKHYDERDYDHFDYDDYSDSYASEYYDEWVCNSDDSYDDRIDDARRYPRRSSKYRSRDGTGREAARPDDGRRRKQRHGGHSDAHDAWRKPRRARLDDPRDNNRVVSVATKAMARQRAAMGPEQAIDPQAVRPRSQFGRMLANIKQSAPATRTPSVKSSVKGSPTPEEHTLDNHVEDTTQTAGHDQETCGGNSASNTDDAAEDVGAHPEQTAEAEQEEEGTAGSRPSPSSTNCPTPAPVNAAIIAAI
ncbi:hypothetical protein H4R20_002866 [Coemansia guatemalensis]|uniref:Uncharacterized protein n=1 Tax=Coemansia guatemalensis TaxID=2761395 RepID=A0A9W8HWR1_9FUNG|nr:hypothetical protein H4R20_002866 [Coemansia guatemalensis]